MNNPEITTEAVRLALGMNQLRAEYASRNIASSNVPGAKAVRLDFAHVQQLLEEAARISIGDDSRLEGRLSAESTNDSVRLQSGMDRRIQVDEEIAEMVGASLAYQTLSQSISRYFGLMRLAATGRS